MKFYPNVKGDLKASRQVRVDKTTVYIHSNVREVTVTDETTGNTYKEYVYDEIQYTRQEWEQILSESAAEMKDSLCQHDIDIEDIKDALCEIDEKLEGGNNNE